MFITKDDRNQIFEVIDMYIKGWNNNLDLFERAFDDDAWIFFNGYNGELNKFLISDSIKAWAETGWIVRWSLISYTKTGDLANVTINFTNETVPEQSYIDTLNLLRFKQGWKITNKTATHASNIS